MSEKVRIGEMFIPILPKKYRQQENYVNCDDILCSTYDIDCHICPVIFHKVKEEKLDIIEWTYDREETSRNYLKSINNC